MTSQFATAGHSWGLITAHDSAEKQQKMTLKNRRITIARQTPLPERCGRLRPVVAGRKDPILLFADDTVLMVRTENVAHRLLARFVKFCEERSLTINCMKTMGVTLRPSTSLRRKRTINPVPIEVTKRFNYLGVRFSDNLNWDCQVRKAATVLKQVKGAILNFKYKAGARSISTILKLYAQKAVAVALYRAQLLGYANTTMLQVAENNFLRILLGLGLGIPLKALFAELGLVPISEIAALKPISYWAGLVRNPRAAVYLETLEEFIVSGGPGGPTSKRP
ncbi:hypothetical protein NDU88_005712 [Pleurodeles waltl]|uniref:Reverse transcriptase domain-containing protein n=1 Tax=Pleurodeles waltl TaxID=8319 RepID=A0AAV7VNP8_PLEWA|nr:hypothetical protein NDU88_005712 [Pleurodeles waltl]